MRLSTYCWKNEYSLKILLNCVNNVVKENKEIPQHHVDDIALTQPQPHMRKP